MKYYIIAGEASGDLHGSNLMKELKLLDTNAEFRFWGGDLMKEQGGELVKHYRELAFMGFIEVIQNLSTILKNIKLCKEDITIYQPDVLILIDYPGFNLRIAKFAKALGLKVVYYISPQIWAWKSRRVYQIKKDVDKMLVILPFEKAFYKKYDYDVQYVGHPLIDAINHKEKSEKATLIEEIGLLNKKIIAILPGSRNQEISKMLPVMLSMKNDFLDYQFVIAGAPSKTKSDYKKYLTDDVPIVFDKTYELLQVSHAALVTSGTATLEAALFGLPQVVCYKANYVSYLIGRMLVKHIKYISLVNLIFDKEVVKELIQNDFNTENLKIHLKAIVSGESRDKMLKEYKLLREKLGNGAASKSAALSVYKSINRR